MFRDFQKATKVFVVVICAKLINHRMLGTIQTVRGNNPSEFRKMIEVYADSSNEREELAFWPLVKRISLKGPWDILRSGAILVSSLLVSRSPKLSCCSIKHKTLALIDCLLHV